LLQQGFTVDQVVHDYGDLCQSIMDLAFDRRQPIDVDEFRTLNRCLDNGIADAVKEFALQRDALLAEGGIQASNERLGYFAHELRNQLNTAMLAVAAIKTGQRRIERRDRIGSRPQPARTAQLDRSLARRRAGYGQHAGAASDRVGGGLSSPRSRFPRTSTRMCGSAGSPSLRSIRRCRSASTARCCLPP
jgi:hypothetical protein